jgi:hypothetical protein
MEETSREVAQSPPSAPKVEGHEGPDASSAPQRSERTLRRPAAEAMSMAGAPRAEPRSWKHRRSGKTARFRPKARGSADSGASGRRRRPDRGAPPPCAEQSAAAGPIHGAGVSPRWLRGAATIAREDARRSRRSGGFSGFDFRREDRRCDRPMRALQAGARTGCPVRAAAERPALGLCPRGRRLRRRPRRSLAAAWG